MQNPECWRRPESASRRRQGISCDRSTTRPSGWALNCICHRSLPGVGRPVARSRDCGAVPRRSEVARRTSLADGPFHGVLAVGDRPTILAAQAAERLGLPGNPPHAAAASGNKLETRARLARRACRSRRTSRCPRLNLAGGPQTIRASSFRACSSRSGSPAAAGSFVPTHRRVRARVRSHSRVALAGRCPCRRGRGLDRTILVERFIEGREVAVEGVLTAGALQVFTIFDKPDPLDGPFFEETIYLTPTSLDVATARSNWSRRFSRPPTRSVSWHGPIHAECRIGPAASSCWKSRRVQSAGCVRRRCAFRVTSRSSRCCCAMPSARTSPRQLASEPRRQ